MSDINARLGSGFTDVTDFAPVPFLVSLCLTFNKYMYSHFLLSVKVDIPIHKHRIFTRRYCILYEKNCTTCNFEHNFLTTSMKSLYKVNLYTHFYKNQSKA
jgi:hypothetical protein